jgi:hypothetical protein
MKDREAEIRQRAHEIWESEGRPEGAHERHWKQAEQELKKRFHRAPVQKKAASESSPLASPLQRGGTRPAGGSAGRGMGSTKNTGK